MNFNTTDDFLISRHSLISFLLLCFFNCITPLHAANDFLAMNEAFQTKISVENGHIKAHWTIAPEHYIYQKSLDIQVETPSKITLGEHIITPKGKLTHDEFMGDVIVHYNTVTASRAYTIAEPQNVTLIATFQGCAEAGLCYPPSQFRTQVLLPATTSDIATTKPFSNQETPHQEKSNHFNFENKSLWRNMILFFALGLGLSLTPCVLPMVPILSSIILGSKQQQFSTKQGFGLSLSYVLGMALVYTGAGLLVALSGARLQIYMQHPYVLWPLSGVFIILALSLFGAFEIRLPNKLHNKLYQLQSNILGGQYVSVFLMGAVSAIIVSPCVSAPLAGILIYIAQEGHAFTGALSLFALALGMGAPLIVLGTTGANILPKAGIWMERVKIFIGFMMIAMALYLVKHLIPEAILYLISAAIIAFLAIWLGAFNQTAPNTSLLSLLSKAIGLCLLVIAALLIQTSWHILAPPSSVLQNSNHSISQQTQKNTINFTTVTTLKALNNALATAKQQNKPAMVDLYADWCIACIEFDKITFQNPQVQEQLQKFALIKLDITDDIETTQILDHFNLIGPPTLLFYDTNGAELKTFRVMGFMQAEPFLNVLTEVLSQQ